MTQLAQGLSFDLPDTFAGHFEILTDFFEGYGPWLRRCRPLPQDLLFPVRERFHALLICAEDRTGIAASRGENRFLSS